MIYIYVWAGVISLISAAAVFIDKTRAVFKKKRVSEKFLFFLAFAGGAAFMYLTMKAIRHKTLHKRFMIGLPVIFVVQIAGFIIYFTV